MIFDKSFSFNDIIPELMKKLSLNNCVSANPNRCINYMNNKDDSKILNKNINLIHYLDEKYPLLSQTQKMQIINYIRSSDIN